MRFGIEEDLQRLLFKGHSMRDEDTLFDYKVNMNDVIQLWRRESLTDHSKIMKRLKWKGS